MDALDRLNESVEKVYQRLDSILSHEKDISQKEENESAELKKLRKISNQLKKTGSEDALREEIHDFSEAVELLNRISTELDQTANDLQKIISEMVENSGKELEIVSKIAGEEIKLTSHEKAEELAENINKTSKNKSELVKSAQRARKESQKAQKELEELMKMEHFIEKIGNKKQINEPEKQLQEAKEQLQDAEWNLSEIPDKIEEIERNNENLIEKIKQDTGMSRRNFLQGAGTVAAAGIVGLSGCSTGERAEIPKEMKQRIETAESKIAKMTRSYNEKKGLMVLNPSSLNFRHQSVKQDTLMIFFKGRIKTSAEGPYSDMNSKISGSMDQEVKEDVIPVFGIFLSSIAENFSLKDLADQNKGGLRSINLVVESHQNKSRLKIELESNNEILREIINSKPSPEEAIKMVSDRVKAVPVL